MDKSLPKEKSLLKEVLDELGSADGAQVLGSQDLSIKIKGVISTGCPSIDAAIGRGGIPLGRLTILHGQEGSGKTTLALHLVASCQKAGGIVIYLDKEYKLDPEYAAALGVDDQRLIIVQPSHLERAFELMEKVINKVAAHRKAGNDTPILIVLDSMNAAITKAQYEGEWEDKHYAPQARVFSSSLPKLIPLVSKERVALLFISQIRKKIGVMFGSDEEICGGQAPKFYASLIMGITKLAATKNEEGDKLSNRIRVECFKNQIAPPFKKAECEIVYGKGIDKERSLLWICEQKGIIVKKGSWYQYGKTQLGQGSAAVAELLREHPGVAERILNELGTVCKWNQ